MEGRSLVIAVRLLDGAYHGVGDWPPSPFRLFQALVAAAHTGRSPTDAELRALKWLGEEAGPPLIAAPKARKSRGATYYVPNNDLDSVGGDPMRIASIRTKKEVAPWLFNNSVPFLYVWEWKTDAQHISEIDSLVGRLYQLGRGVDIAYGTAEIRGADEVAQLLAEHGGTVHRPTPGGGGRDLQCPTHGSLSSLARRHAEQLKRLGDNTLRQAPKPIFHTISYDSPPTRLLFDIAYSDPKAGFSSQPIERVAALTESIRNHAAARLASHVGDALVERVIIGRNASEADKESRIRIIPLASIGFVHADRQVRRILVEIPSACPIRTVDIAWAFSGLDLGVDAQTGEIIGDYGWLLVRSEERSMLAHYGIDVADDEKARVWRTVTPIALPLGRRRGKIGGHERAAREAALVHDVRQALRHAGLSPNAEVPRVQREPFEGKGMRAEAFAYGERFSAYRLHHVEIAFAEPISGPIVIGDGRYLGLGLMRPVHDKSSSAKVERSN